VDAFLDRLDVIVTLILSVAGFYFANSFRRKSRLELADARRAAYSQLWALTEVARPTRLGEEEGKGPLTPRERKALYDAMTSWYYQDGNGMLLEKSTRELYLAAKHNLVCPVEELQPPGVLVRCAKGEQCFGERYDLGRPRIPVVISRQKSDKSVLERLLTESAGASDSTGLDAVCAAEPGMLDRAPLLGWLPSSLFPRRTRAYCKDNPGNCRLAPLLSLFPGDMTEDERRGCLSMRQLSLLRGQMKTDLAIFGLPWIRDLRLPDRAFLCEAGLMRGPVQSRLARPRFWNRDPWAESSRRSAPIETCR
jgi:hypothetical protein